MPEFHTSPSAIVVIQLVLLSFMVILAVAIVRIRRLFSVVMLSGIYSLLSAAFFVALDAVDVAFTEAAVGAGISTVLMLSGMLLTSRREKKVKNWRSPIAFIVCLVVGGVLVYATFDMPAFGDPNAPANAYVGKDYLERSPSEMVMPNVVTGVLASYRGFDTLGEVLVVFTAGLAVMLLLGVGSMRGGRKVLDPMDEIKPAAVLSCDDALEIAEVDSRIENAQEYSKTEEEI